MSVSAGTAKEHQRCEWCTGGPKRAALEVKSEHNIGHTTICAGCAVNMIKAVAGMLAVTSAKIARNLKEFFFRGVN